MDDLGKNIKLLRQERGWSQGEFAKRLKISVPAFSKIENGLTDMHISRLKHIADVLSITPVELLAYRKPIQANEANELQEAKDKAVEYMVKIRDLQRQVIVLHEEIYNLNNAKAVYKR